MKIYAFSSENLTNIWAAVGAQMWAVPVSKSEASNKGRATKAKSVSLGAAGILYSSKDRCFTSPFLVASLPDPDTKVCHVWPGEWMLPFRIQTLGSPHRRLPWAEASSLLPSVIAGKPLNKLIHVEPLTVFAASEISDEDWAVLIEKLSA